MSESAGGPGAPLRLGTRGSALALAQTGLIAARLQEAGMETTVVTIRTEGDRAQADRSMMLGRGAFVKELERALLEGDVDLAVHSAKDLPTGESPGLAIVAWPEREDPRDALVSATGAGLADLPPGARVGTESPRRRAFLLRARPDLAVTPIRGNVDTRLAKLDAGDYDALVVAVAGLVRLGRAGRISERLEPAVMLPAVGQGALAVQMRAEDPRAAEVGRLDHPATRTAVLAERAFLDAMGGGCRAPFAALAGLEGDRMELSGAALDPDGREALFDRVEGGAAEAEPLGRSLAGALLGRGAGRFGGEPAT